MPKKYFSKSIVFFTLLLGASAVFALTNIAFTKAWPSLSVEREEEVRLHPNIVKAIAQSRLGNGAQVTATWQPVNATSAGLGVYKFNKLSTVRWSEISFKVSGIRQAMCLPRYQGGQFIRCRTPLLIDEKMNGFQLSNVNEGVFFDYDGDGIKENTHWVATGTDDEFLAIDLNNNSMIDSGEELFGDATVLLQSGGVATDGYEALRQYDLAANGGNNDNKITKKDSVWEKLILWNDKNADGKSDKSELRFVSNSAYKKFKLRPKHNENNIDINGSLLQDWSWVKTDKSMTPSRRRMVDVYFSPIVD